MVKRGAASRRYSLSLYITAGGLLALVVLVVVVSLSGANPNAQTAAGRLLAPSRDHIFGTDELRRDLFVRTVIGLRTSLLLAIPSVAAGALLGTAVGAVAGYAGRWIDASLMRGVDVLLAFPELLAALLIAAVVGPGLEAVAIAIVVVTAVAFARISRGQLLAERHRDYVRAAEALGASRGRVVARHIMPNAAPPLLVQLTFALATAILVEAGLSFLGLGQQPPDPSLGSLLNTSRGVMHTAWWYPLFPGAALGGTILLLTLLADTLQEATRRPSQ